MRRRRRQHRQYTTSAKSRTNPPPPTHLNSRFTIQNSLFPRVPPSKTGVKRAALWVQCPNGIPRTRAVHRQRSTITNHYSPFTIHHSCQVLTISCHLVFLTSVPCLGHFPAQLSLPEGRDNCTSTKSFFTPPNEPNSVSCIQVIDEAGCHCISTPLVPRPVPPASCSETSRQGRTLASKSR